MTTEITIFNNEEFGQIRTLQVDETGEVLFCGADVCKALGYEQTHKAIRRHVHEDDGTKRPIIDSLGRRQLALFVNESGLYALIMGSQLDSARRFKHWVTSEVLPSIRREGGYMAAYEGESKETLMARALHIMQRALDERDGTIRELQVKADYVDEVLESADCMTTTQVAKELEMSAQQLNSLLVEQGIQYGQSGQYMLYADYARRGYAKNRTSSYRDSEGVRHSCQRLVWTERGRRFIHNLLRRG